MMTALASAQERQSPPLVSRQSLDDAWWTGPMLAPSAATLPRGHFLIEPFPLGVQTPPAIELNSGSSEALGLAPAIEYSWKSNLGVLLGVRVIAAGRNTAATVSPAVAINMVF
jgi:hypothetical protein